MQIFVDDSDYIRFLDLLADVVEEFQLECWSFCVLPNHYHLAIVPTLPNMSAAIRHLNGSYAQWWNRRHETVGHVFQGRFKDQIVDRESYLLALCRYIALNPVRAALVADPRDWRWSSYAATVGVVPVHPVLAASKVLRQFGDDDDDVNTLQARYATFVLSATSHVCTDERIRSREQVLGPSTFKTAIKAQRSEPRDLGMPQDARATLSSAAVV